MSLVEEYRRRAVEAEGLAMQTPAREAQRWRALAHSWRTLADRLERERASLESGRLEPGRRSDA